MADTLTPNLKLTDQEEGSNNNSWGTIVDANWHRLDAVLGDTTEITTTGGETVLSDEQELVAAIRVDGTLASNAEIVFSGRGGFWIVENATEGDYTLTCLVDGRTGVLIEQGTSQLIWCDGTDIFPGNTTPDAAPEVTLASGSTTDVLGAGSEFVAISGTSTITSFGTGPNRKRFCRATGAFTITHNVTSLICPGGANIKAAAGDTFFVISDASSNVRIFAYQRAATPPQAVPVGAVMDFAGDTAPPFWLLCYGQEVSRTEYAALFAALGTTYGVGNGVTTFNLPDLRGRVTAGKDNMGGTSADRLTNQSGGLNGEVLGATGGFETHTLTIEQIPAHKHSGTTEEAGSHNHDYDRLEGGSPAMIDSGTAASPDFRNFTRQTSEAGNHTHGFTTGNTGGGQAHNNVQPTIVLNKIIFAGV